MTERLAAYATDMQLLQQAVDVAPTYGIPPSTQPGLASTTKPEASANASAAPNGSNGGNAAVMGAANGAVLSNGGSGNGSNDNNSGNAGSPRGSDSLNLGAGVVDNMAPFADTHNPSVAVELAQA
jgi:hypothetical protein